MPSLRSAGTRTSQLRSPIYSPRCGAPNAQVGLRGDARVRGHEGVNERAAKRSSGRFRQCSLVLPVFCRRPTDGMTAHSRRRLRYQMPRALKSAAATTPRLATYNRISMSATLPIREFRHVCQPPGWLPRTDDDYTTAAGGRLLRTWYVFEPSEGRGPALPEKRERSECK